MSEVREWLLMVASTEREQEKLWGDGLDPNVNYKDVLSLWKFIKLYNCDMCTYL